MNMSDVTASYGTTLDSVGFILEFSYIINGHSCLKCYVYTLLDCGFDIKISSKYSTSLYLIFDFAFQ